MMGTDSYQQHNFTLRQGHNTIQDLSRKILDCGQYECYIL
jgi:hypothetical protein